MCFNSEWQASRCYSQGSSASGSLSAQSHGPIFPLVGEGEGQDGFPQDQIHESSISNSTVHLNHPWILLSCRFSFRSGMRPEVLHSGRFLGDASAAGGSLGTTIWIAGFQGHQFSLHGDGQQIPNAAGPFCNTGFWSDEGSPDTSLF